MSGLLNIEKAALKYEIENSNHIRQWIVKLFGIQSWNWWNQANELEKALSNPKVLFEAFSKLKSDNTNIEQIKQNTSNLNYTLSQKNQQIQNLQQKIESLKRENSSADRLQARIEELERENQELHMRVSSILGQLSASARDKSTTITSNDSRRQRDVLTRDFIQLNNQDFTSASNQIFSHLCQANPTLRDNRKREIARIIAVFNLVRYNFRRLTGECEVS